MLPKKKTVLWWCKKYKMRIIHILKYGLALCGAGPPERWPTAHRWIGFEDYDKELGQHSFCWECEDMLAKARASV